ncbi:hypothetical protein C8Q74DRAFT_1293017 [Fomes fomentarius]|nr:hypothetical protein C8Q74DRAFT_1293017 [Fomes fomentarius]
MSVHRFLTNIDVLYAVFAHLDLFPIPLTATDLGSDRLATVEGDSALIRRTLANAALTCRAFSGPASKTLWTCLHLHVGLWPLLKLFEQDVAMGGNQFYVIHELTHARCLTDTRPSSNSTARSQ